MFDIEAVVFDVLGTMVDEPGGLRRAIREALPGAAEEALVERLLAVWQEHVERQQRRIAEGSRDYVGSEVIDREAAERVAEHAGIIDRTAVERLAAAGQRLDPWGDSAAGLARIAERFPVLGLSNADRATLVRLNAHAGLRWHQVLSAEAVRAYKPAPQVYRLALDVVGCPPERVLMVAAHAWDLRAGQALGMRTAYIRRPVGDSPGRTDTFDLQQDGLEDLAGVLAAPGQVGRPGAGGGAGGETAVLR
ncbi:haloacid dehalogenase type II [Nocardiopsis sp. FIRDI 009]|uniref:haloacid dehalogenase type II n=1 Tax=Nocardiopsis sp. FIRDI 009 TaxID=714197 RepID=UPI000E232600|nr:haloacid dehalogenase type II [Nocardiopsis sp. FIRDI 009]